MGCAQAGKRTGRPVCGRELVAETEARRLASPGVWGRAPWPGVRAETRLCGSRGNMKAEAPFFLLLLSPSGRSKLRVLRGAGWLGDGGFPEESLESVCGSSRSFLEPLRLICSLIAKTLLIIRAETHRNHFLFIYVDFLFCFWFLGTPNNSVGVTLSPGLAVGLQKWKVTCNEISRRWGWDC